MPDLLKNYNTDIENYGELPTENFDRKTALFREKCSQARVTDDEKPLAFSIVLKGLDLQYYFDALQGKNYDLKTLVRMTKERFITAEHTQTLIRKWDERTLHTMISRNREKSPTDYLEILVSRL